MAAAGFNLSAPDSLKAVNHYMKLATEYDQRDPAISYYCVNFWTYKLTYSIFNIFDIY